MVQPVIRNSPRPTTRAVEERLWSPFDPFRLPKAVLAPPQRGFAALAVSCDRIQPRHNVLASAFWPKTSHLSDFRPQLGISLSLSMSLSLTQTQILFILGAEPFTLLGNNRVGMDAKSWS